MMIFHSLWSETGKMNCKPNILRKQRLHMPLNSDPGLERGQARHHRAGPERKVLTGNLTLGLRTHAIKQPHGLDSSSNSALT